MPIKDKLTKQIMHIIREKMSDKQFWNWAQVWVDTGEICDMYNNYLLFQCTDQDLRRELKDVKSYIHAKPIKKPVHISKTINNARKTPAHKPSKRKVAKVLRKRN